MKVEIIEDNNHTNLEWKINNFIKNIKVVDIKYKIFNRSGISNMYNAMIMYEEN